MPPLSAAWHPMYWAGWRMWRHHTHSAWDRACRPVDDLVETSTTNRPITAADVQTMQGKGQVHVVYRGTQHISWAGCTPRPPQTQAALQHHHPVEMSLADFAVLRDRYGEDTLMVVPHPTWEP